MPVPLFCELSYRVPSQISHDEFGIGYRVQVPFRGKSVWGVIMKGPYLGYQARVRDLLTVDDSRCWLTPDICELVRWTADYYRAPVGEVVKLAMPPGALESKTSVYRLTASGRQFHQQEGDELDAKQLRVLNGSMTREQWQSAAQTNIAASDLRDWEQKGWIELIGGFKHAIPWVDVVRLTSAGQALAVDSLGRSAKRKRVLTYLQGQPHDWLKIRELNRHVAGGSSVLSALADAGLVEKTQIDEAELDRQQNKMQDSLFVMTSEQKIAFEAIEHSIRDSDFSAYLLFGVTGSGKTEVYLNAIERCLKEGRQALFLVPEISLTPMMHRRIQTRFGPRLAILHSAIGKARRAKEWGRVLHGKADVVLGARSAVFAPLPRLGLIIVDEEHDGSYKQNEGVRYHARSLALVRAKQNRVPIVLGSATPALETWQLAQSGKYQMLCLKQRAKQAAVLPKVEIVDMREEFKQQKKRTLFSRSLLARMDSAMQENQQIMILLNRRGFHSFMMCRKCGEALMCHQCEVTLTYHRDSHRLHCHYCDDTSTVPSQCAQCGKDDSVLQFFGEGTQQVESELQRRYGADLVDRLDRDRLNARDTHQTILDRFRRGESRILVGTQMIAKGHDFPLVTVVGILNADIGLRVPDLRAAESTFQLLTQVSGRSGRGELPGHVVVQSYMPDHYSIQFAASHEYTAFAERELRYRDRLFYPPFAHLVQMIVRHKDEQRAREAASWIAQELGHSQEGKKLVVLGPSKAPVAKVKNVFRFQVLVKSDARSWMHELTSRVIDAAVRRKLLNRNEVILDVDPTQFA